MTRPVVSVIIPTYNRAALLPRAVQSVVNQTVGDWELLLVDDGSTDATSELAEDFSRALGTRFAYLRQSNRGASAARNAGIDAACGEFICFLDSDDEFCPDKLERQLELLERCPSLGFVYSDYAFVDLDGRRHSSVFDETFSRARTVPARQVAPRLHVCDGTLFDMLLGGYFISTIVGMVRRDALGTHIRFNEDLTYAEEWLFYLELAHSVQTGFVDEPLSIHYYVKSSLSRLNKQRNTYGYCQTLRAIEARFPRLIRAQRKALDHQLSVTLRQLAFNAKSEHRSWDALRYMAGALRRRFDAHSVKTAMELSLEFLSSASWCFFNTQGFSSDKQGRAQCHPMV